MPPQCRPLLAMDLTMASESEKDESLPALELVLLENGLRAVVPNVFPHTTSDELLQLLQDHGIPPVYHKAAIRKAVEAARETGQTMDEVVVAEGRPPQVSQPPRLDYHAPEGLDELPSLEPVRRLIALRDREALVQAASTVSAWLVEPGHCLASLDYAEGKAGESVLGKLIPPIYETSDAGVIEKLQPGAGVELADNGVDFVAVLWGYAGMKYGQVTVIPGLWVAPDEMEAGVVNLPRIAGSGAPKKENLQALLAYCDITFGIDESAISGLSETDMNDGASVLTTVARGRAAIPAHSTEPVFHFAYDPQVGTVRSDGTIDFKQRNLFPAVAEHELLVECALPAHGEPGQTVRGKEIAVAPPTNVELAAGENVALETEQGVQRLRAETQGGASVKTDENVDESGTLLSRQISVSVQPVSNVPGNVDYKTGHIDFQGNVIVGGSVASGFHVKATGDVAISGSVEPGGEVQAGGDVTVQQGISGSESKIDAGGTVTAKFVQDARVSAAADVVVASYLRGAHTQAGGSVHVEGMGGSGGGLVGGETWAVKSISSRNVGAEGSSTTSVFLGLLASQLARIKHARQNVKKTDSMLNRLQQAAGVASFDTEEFRAHLAQRPEQKEKLVGAATEAARFSEIRQQQLDEEKELLDLISQDTGLARIEILEQASGKVDIHFGFHRMVLTETLNHVRVRHDPGADEPGIVWSDLS
jgi:uncharacterized protein (DUF342 family)